VTDSVASAGSPPERHVHQLLAQDEVVVLGHDAQVDAAGQRD
jgi:hypothetical protein